MPTLGFLKKKRTRDGNSDQNSSAPSSPVTASYPRGSRTFEAAPTSPAASSRPQSFQQPQPQQQQQKQAQQSHQSQHSQQFHLQLQQQQQHQQQQAQPVTSTPSTESAVVEQQRQQQQSRQMNPVTVQSIPPSYATNPTNQTDPQNLPSISNLINPPQHDGNAHQHTYANYSSPVDQRMANTVSPATALDRAPPPPQHHQQQQPAAMLATPPPSQTHVASPAQAYSQSPSPSVHQQAQLSSDVRITKGKYTLVDFDILRTLGTGSFGRVHLVQSKHNQRFYAVKVLKKAQVVKMKQVEHTNDERRMLGEVKHPFLITLWGTFQDSKNLYMVMDFVEGGELFSLLRKSGRFPNPVAKFYAAEVTLALEYLHSKNIIYRDLKPENLLLDRHGHLKITDFGFAKRVPDKTWTLCGTPDYLAPEVVSNKGYNKSVDWWSLGILIYEMLCGYTPFWDSGSPMKIYENILRGKVRYPAYINPDAQDLLERLITADLTKRLGNLFGGPQDVKGHPWFTEVTWDRLARKDIDAPYTPPVKAGTGDASQFDRYPEDPERYGQSGSDEYGGLFEDF